MEPLQGPDSPSPEMVKKVLAGDLLRKIANDLSAKDVVMLGSVCKGIKEGIKEKFKFTDVQRVEILGSKFTKLPEGERTMEGYRKVRDAYSTLPESSRYIAYSALINAFNSLPERKREGMMVHGRYYYLSREMMGAVESASDSPPHIAKLVRSYGELLVNMPSSIKEEKEKAGEFYDGLHDAIYKPNIFSEPLSDAARAAATEGVVIAYLGLPAVQNSTRLASLKENIDKINEQHRPLALEALKKVCNVGLEEAPSPGESRAASPRPRSLVPKEVGSSSRTWTR